MVGLRLVVLLVWLLVWRGPAKERASVVLDCCQEEKAEVETEAEAGNGDESGIVLTERE